MAITMSVSASNMLARGCSLEALFEGGELQLWSGTAPGVDSAATGSLICAITAASAARTAEIQATAIVTLIGGPNGSVDVLTVDGYDVLGAVVNYNSSLTQTAADVVTQINSFTGAVIKVWATSSAEVITIRACPGQGARANALAIVCTTTTMTNSINGASPDNLGEGAGGSTAGVTSVAGLQFGPPSSGVISISGTWSGTVLVGSTAVGYARLEGCNTPTGTSGADTPTSSPRYRLQFNTVGISGADFNMPGGSTLVAATPFTVNSGTITIPRS